MSSVAPWTNSLIGRELVSELQPQVRYRLDEPIGQGGMGVVFLAQRQSPTGASTVVVKVIHPEVMATEAQTARMSVQKEVVALGRLDEAVPRTPFVVRFIDTGMLELRPRVSVPWIATEYVHGGAEGTTLGERVRHACEVTGTAFGVERAAHAVRCLSEGLGAIHRAGVVHRDLTPGNVLACGVGESEVFKISDFGLAKPQGLAVTFGGVMLGTPGYAAPEQTFDEQMGVGPHTDVFSLACVVYLVLTGEPYFNARSATEAIFAVKEDARRSIREAPLLAPQLARDPRAVQGIDSVLAAATAFDVAARPPSAQAFCDMLLPYLGGAPQSLRMSPELLREIVARSRPAAAARYRWTVHLSPGAEIVVYAVGWEGDGHCVATTSAGLLYWDGERWSSVSVTALEAARGVRIVRRLDAGEWLLGSADGTLVHLSAQGAAYVVGSPDSELVYQDASGKPQDLLVVLCRRPGSDLMLVGMAARRWMKPLPLPGVAHVAALERLDDNRWILCGRKTHGVGFVAIFEPMMFSLTEVPVPHARAYVAIASQPERAMAIVVGTAGQILSVRGEQVEASVIPGEPDLSAAGLDLGGTEWVAAVGRIWSRPAAGADWGERWRDPGWQAPFASLAAELGRLTAVSVDGGVLAAQLAEGA